jgi:hypothetical protein
VKVIKNALAELYSMFVDDPLFVALVLVWIAVCYVARHTLPRSIVGPALFSGFAILLAAFCYRQACRLRRK